MSEKLKKAIGYIRVSTNEQAKDDKFGIDAQKEAITKYATDNGFVIVEWLKDVVSGAKEQRPAWDSVLYKEEIAQPPYDAIIVYKHDRVARRLELFFYYLFVLKRKGIELHSVYDDLNLDSPQNKFMVSTLVFVAEMERENIKLRTMAGKNIKAQQGGFCGGQIPYGYTTLHGVLQKSEIESPIVKMVFEMRGRGMTLQAICDYLNDSGIKTKTGKEWKTPSVYSILGNKKFYQGFKRFNDTWVIGNHERILEDE